MLNWFERFLRKVRTNVPRTGREEHKKSDSSIDGFLSSLLKPEDEILDSSFTMSFNQLVVERHDHPVYEGKRPEITSPFDQTIWDKIQPSPVKDRDKILVKMLREDLQESWDEVAFWLFYWERLKAEWKGAKLEGNEDVLKRLKIEGIRIHKHLSAATERCWCEINDRLNLWGVISMAIRKATHGYCLVIPVKKDD